MAVWMRPILAALHFILQLTGCVYCSATMAAEGHRKVVQAPPHTPFFPTQESKKDPVPAVSLDMLLCKS